MKPLLPSAARPRHAAALLLLGLLLSSATAATASTTTTTLIKSPANSCLGTLTERLQTCMAHNNENQTATDCIELALRQGMSPCLESASELLHACATQGLGLSACLRSSPFYQLIEEQAGAGLLPSNNNTSSAACRAALETASQTTAGAEALLASGRALLVFGLVGKLLVDFNQTGIPPLYLFYGHVESYGDADGCKTIPGFQYCSAYLDFMPMARAGVCVPQECSLEDLAGFVNPLLQIVGRRSNVTVPEVDLHHVQGQCGDYSFKAGVGTWVMTSITGLLVLLVLAGTWFDYQKQQREKEAREEELGGGDEGDEGIDDEVTGGGGKKKVHDGYSRLEERKNKSNNNSNRRSGEEKDAFNEVDLEKAPLMNGGGNGNGTHTQTQTQTKQDKPSPSLARQILSCFSLYRTWPSLVGPARPGQFNALDGVRCFSMSWVVLGHLLVFPVGLLGYTNQDALLPPDGVLGTYIGQAIVSAEFSVDTFFCIGAFIAAYMLTQYLQKENKKRSETGQDKQSWVWWPMLYLHRYLRLTPLYFYVILMFMYVMPMVNSGPYWGLLQNEIGKCEKYWWANLLYINTLVPWDSTLDQCYPVSWYMSVDMQLFLLLPLLVVVYVWNKRVGYLLPALLWVASVSYAYYLGYGEGVSQFAFGLSVTDATAFQTEYYFRSWSRAPVYLLGVVFAFFYLDYEQALKQDRDSDMDDNTWLAAFARPFANNRKKRMNLPVAVLFLISFALLGLTCYGAEPAYHAPGLTHFLDYSYLALSRSAWCLGLLILCFLLFQGYGGPILSLLDNPACAVLSRLTFAAYLIHPALINMVFADATLPSHYSPIWVSFNFLGTLTAVFMFSAVGFLLVEKPCANLERVLMGGGGKGKKEK